MLKRSEVYGRLLNKYILVDTILGVGVRRYNGFPSAITIADELDSNPNFSGDDISVTYGNIWIHVKDADESQA